MDIKPNSRYTDYKPFGSMVKFNVINRIKKPLGDILYLPGPFPLRAFRNLLSNGSDKISYEVSKNIISTLCRLDLKFKIKPHPEVFYDQISYFKKLVTLYNCKPDIIKEKN